MQGAAGAAGAAGAGAMEEGPQLDVVKPASKQVLTEQECFAFARALQSPCAVPAAPSPPQSALSGRVLWVDNLLSAQECGRLRELVDACPLLSFWRGVASAEARAFRDADTIEMNSAALGQVLWDRLQLRLAIDDHPPLISPRAVSEADDGELAGVWTATSPLNHDLLFAKYPSEGSFAPHTDGRAIHHFNRRSFQSVIIFLNDVPDGCGGGTRFYTDSALTQLQRDAQGRWTADPTLVEFEVLPRAGRILIFDQELVHEGVPPTSGHEKYIIRSDVMYSRSPAVCDGPQDREAYTLFRKAEALAEAGEVDESLLLFSKSWKMSPLMARMMGQA